MSVVAGQVRTSHTPRATRVDRVNLMAYQCAGHVVEQANIASVSLRLDVWSSSEDSADAINGHAQFCRHYANYDQLRRLQLHLNALYVGKGTIPFHPCPGSHANLRKTALALAVTNRHGHCSSYPSCEFLIPQNTTKSGSQAVTACQANVNPFLAHSVDSAPCFST